MAAVVPLPFTLPAADSSAKTVASSSISSPSQAIVFPAGPSYVAHARRQLRQLDFDADDEAEQARLSSLSKASGSAEDDVELPEEEESKDLLARDPKDWKTQDHYAVLGLSSLRYKATPLQIKVAHRRKVLKHHPDKKAGATGLTNDDTFYKCITRAHDVLSNPEKRRQFDSVDEGIDDEAVPSGKEAESKFFALWTPVFERESRFNDEKKSGKAPALGDMNSTKEHVDHFYDFWYNFDSWRSFEYLDKEINEGSDSRDDKRYTEKKNRNDRARRKKEDNARLRNLVDKALSVDPRIKKFKADEKAAREAKKNKGKPGQAGTGNAAQLAEEKKKKEAEELKRKEDEAKQAEADKAARADAKKVKEAAKKNLKKHKKVLRDLITSNNYFEPTGTSPSASVIEAKLNGLDAITAALAEEPEKVQALRERCEKAGSADAIKKELAAVAEEKGVAKDAFA